MIEGVGFTDFVHLHSHTDYSMRDSTMKVKEYIKRIKELGMTACAVTEHGNLFSMVEFYNECKENNIKPIIGTEMYTIPTKEMAQSSNKDEAKKKYHLVLLAKDNVGYQQISKAVTKGQLLKEKKTYPRITYQDMRELFVGGHVICLSGCMNGEIAELILNKKYDEAEKLVLFYQDIFGKDNYYLEIQNHGLEQEKKIMAFLIKLSNKTGIPLVATNDCHYANKESKHTREMIVAMRWGITVSDMYQKNTNIESDKKIVHEPDCGELYVKSQKEMYELFKAVPQALENTKKIADQCNIVFEKKNKYPIFKTPNGETEDEYLRELAYKGLYKRFPLFDTFTDAIKKEKLERLEYELDTIKTLNYSGYLLIVQDFIKEGKRIGMVGPGRGSAVGSLVSYLIEITNIDPMKYDLLFERFLNKDRVSEPDIDTDFCDMRDIVIEYVKSKYGENAVCNIITINKSAARASIRNAGRVTSKDLPLCDKIAKMIPSRPGITIKEALDENIELKNEYINNRLAKELIDDAMLLEGLNIQTGVHAAGVIIADRDVSDYIPLIYDEDSNTWISQFDKDVCEGFFGLLKMDFLGLKNLTIIKRTLGDIKKNHGIDIDLDNLPMDDPNVIREIFVKGKTKAVFQFESFGMVNLLRRFQPESIEDLILLNAAYRPGPLQYLDEIIMVKNGKKKPTYIVPKMKNILSLTYGKPIYQEQIMKIFSDVAGFSLGVADIIRRAMSKKKTKELEKYMPKFEENLIKEKATKEQAKAFSDELMEFSKYAFNKSHAAAYAVVAYITAYLKYYYPVEYMANVLTLASVKELPVYIKECKDMGIPVLPPSVNESELYFTPTKNRTIRFGLFNIKNVGKASSDIIEERNDGGEYTSLKDFVERLVDKNTRALYKQVVESLIKTGAFDEFGLNRRQMVEGCVDYIKNLKEYKKKLESPKTKASTLEKWKAIVDGSTFDIDLTEYPKKEILEIEKDLIGYYASGHPLDEYKAIIDTQSEINIGDINEDENGKIVTIVGQIVDFKPLYTKKDNQAMGKFTLLDMTGEVNCIAFTKVYAECKEAIEDGAIVAVKGRIMVDVDPDEPELTEIQINVIEVKKIKSGEKLFIKIKDIYQWRKVKSFIEQRRGSKEVYVYIVNEEKLLKTKLKVELSDELMRDLLNKAKCEAIIMAS